MSTVRVRLQSYIRSVCADLKSADPDGIRRESPSLRFVLKRTRQTFRFTLSRSDLFRHLSHIYLRNLLAIQLLL